VLQEHFTYEATGQQEQPILLQEHTYRNTGNPSAREYPLYRVDQNPIFIEEIVLPVQDREQRFMGNLLSLRDVTEEKHTAIHRQRIQDMVLHDLSKPLASIVTSMDVMRLILSMEVLAETSTKELDQIIDISTNSANSLLVLVASLRDIPRLGKGEMPIVRAPTSVRVLAEESRAMLAASLNEAKITLTIDVPPALDRLDIDSELIRRVFVNLMHNAFKFTPEQGQIAFVVDDRSQKQGYVRVMISDTGPGIPATMREKIFDEYVQIDNIKPHQGGKGTGVGLTFCKLAIEAHGGRIWVESDGLLPGACFAMLLPLAAPSDDPTQQVPQHEGNGTP
jgi:two-component system, NtrC family, sensor histidine kinase KinB